MTQMNAADPRRSGSAKEDTRLQMRLTAAQKALLEQAARTRGLSLTDFVLSTALPEAERTIADRTFFVLDEEAWRTFTGRLEEPARDHPRLRAQLERVRNSRWNSLLPPELRSSA